MAKSNVPKSQISQDKWRYGHLSLIDDIPAGDEAIAVAIDCNRCGFTLDIQVNMRKKVKAGIGT